MIMKSDFLTKTGLVVATLVVAIAACAEGTVELPPGQGGDGGSGPGGMGGDGGMMVFPCGIDCSAIMAPTCLKSVCNEGQYLGPVGSCVVVNDDSGVACDDGMFCTADESCDGMGHCVAGPTVNDCGMEAGQCQQVQCNEASQDCSLVPSMNGTFCTPTDLCLVNATCVNGLCAGGTPKDCFFAPVPNECWIAVCDPGTGQCVPQPNGGANGNPCQDPGQLCTVSMTCDGMGNCTGGVPKDCSALTVGCNNGVCEMATGNCIQQPVPPGGMCAQATDDCNNGICDMNGMCNGVPTNEGGVCDDFDGCTSGTTCSMGNCTGGSVINMCAMNDGCCPPGCDNLTDNDCIRPNVMVCGWDFFIKNVLDFSPPMVNFNLIPVQAPSQCVPDQTVQAIFFTRYFQNGMISAATLQNYLQNGGIVLTEYSMTFAVFSLAFGNVPMGFNTFGSCTDCMPTVTQFSPADQFWIDNVFVPQNLFDSGCGYDVAALPGLTPISGWDPTHVSVGYRDLGNGRFWATDFDWSDNEMYPCLQQSEQLMGYIMIHK
jgi:hypothetical protein